MGKTVNKIKINLEHFIAKESTSLNKVLKLIELNNHGVAFTVDSFNKVTGSVTDGDIRRKLIDSASLSDSIAVCLNRNFVWADEETSRELLLKQLDHRIRVIPILNKNKQLVDLVSRDYLPIQKEEQIYARARSPVRVSFGGGGSDLTHYFADESGAVINTTISLYSHATLRKRKDSKISIYSQDLNDELRVDNFQELLKAEGKFGLLQALLRTIHPDFGFDLYLHSDFPMRSGLGGSAVVAAAVLGCFNQFRQDKWDQHDLAELAFQAERLYLGVSGGWQDQYATVFGGFNFMEFRMEQNIVHPLRVQHETLLELEESLVLCDTQIAHDSGEIHNDQKQKMQKHSVRDKVQSNVELTYRMRNYLLRGQLIEFGRCLHKAWLYKRQFGDKISSDGLDTVYELALNNGAIGGKLLGAGGGGFFLFYVPPFAKHKLIGALEKNGQKVCPFRFEPNGLQAWSVREGRNQSGDDTHDV